MGGQLPRIELLPYFDAAARHLSFKRAAQELCVTPSAVSQRIADLEARLGLKLFVRETRAVRLTEAGAFYADAAALVLRRHREGYERLLRLYGEASLRVSATPIVAHELLIPRIGAFHARFPAIDLRIETCFATVDLAVEPVDVCVRFGGGKWLGTHATKVGDVELALCGSASLAQGVDGLEDVLGGPLVSAHPSFGDWRLFCATVGCALPSERQFVMCGSHVEAAVLAAQGKGAAVALLPTMAGWLHDGRLVSLLAQRWESPMSYYVVCQEGREHEASIQAFTQWLSELFVSL